MAKKLTKNDEEHPGMIFIPDISGFTKFVHGHDIKIGREIVAELLSTILNENILDLKVSEIEGDAILFYRYGFPPTLKNLMDQYELMLIAFKRKLHDLTDGLTSVMSSLSLKLIVHYGIIAEYKLYGFKKLYGATIVDAHKLLKNDIPSPNYILVTRDFLLQIKNQKEDKLVLPEWIIKKKNNVDDLAFTYFLYDIELFRETVLKNIKIENPIHKR